MKKIMAILAGVVAAFCALFALPACNNDANTLVIGYTLYAPMNYEDENGKLIGFDTEFAEKVCAELGYTPKFQLIDWDNKVLELNSGNIDLIWNGMTITDELKSEIAISDPYMENKQVVVVRTADAERFTDIASLVASAKSVAVESGSAGENVITEAGYAAAKINLMQAQSDCLIEVLTSRSDVAIIDLTMAKAMTGAGTDYSGLTFIDVGFEGEEYGIGMRKSDTELLSNINALIAQYKIDGTFDELIAKYMV